MTTPDPELPTTLAEAHALILALAAERQAIEAENSRIASEMATVAAANASLAAVNQTADARIVELTAIVKILERTLYGTRSERLRSDRPSDEQIAFAFDEIATGVAAIEAELANAGDKDKPKRAPRPRKEFGAHLERIEIVIEPEVPPGCAGLEKVLIGEDVSKRLDATPAKFRLIVTRRPKYAYRNRDGVLQAPAPAHLIESGLATEALLAQIAVAKYADGLPLYRQEAIYARDGVDLAQLSALLEGFDWRLVHEARETLAPTQAGWLLGPIRTVLNNTPHSARGPSPVFTGQIPLSAARTRGLP